ncbi:iron export ABC transporter permease subunit FetB [Salinisphaera sp. USBA-960]|uniref:ABC transporter permease n=1 Tax=Salinisphaera orenii TaxID=856731 RepID=UPI000DBE9AE1|nr:iron export ABC transporter permease subunit FetB [Salifodinibacter halophilus]NNC26570.1 iron export ABC transporter permease subunit FetB [Salifodinibacter halophilus]
MNADYVEIDAWQLGLAAVLIVVNLAISAWLRLGLGKTLGVASLRMTVQLLLVGLILNYIFALEAPLPVIGIGLVMATFASVSAINRTRRRFVGVYWNSLLSVLSASFVITGVAILGILDIQPWFRAQYAIPLLGMILGNILNGVSLALDRFMDGVVTDRDRIEGDLALGASRWEAAHALVNDSVRTGMIPIINSMMVMGVVNLPGIMTGQILAGAAPADAVRYQIVFVFMLAAATALATLGIVLLAFRVLFSPNHQLRTDRLYTPAQHPAWATWLLRSRTRDSH